MTDDIKMSRFRHPNGNLNWKVVIPHAATLARGRTIRQVFCTLVASGIVVNTHNAYNRLCRLSAEAKRQGTFPDTLGESRRIHQRRTVDSVAEAMASTIDSFRLDRTRGQDV